MYKQSSGRNNRPKGFKIKHAIQLFVLVAICIWLIYQVKHSHDKKREFDEKNIKTATSSLSNGAGDEVIKFGRKDVQDRFEKTTLVTDGKVEEAEGHEEDNTNKENEQEEEDIKHGEKEDEGRGGGDDEIDESDQHKFDMELEHEENLIDEKDAEGKDTEDREDSEEEEGERRSEERENSEEVGEEGERRSEEKENSGEEEGERRPEERDNSEEGEGEKRPEERVNSDEEEEEEEREKRSEREEEDHDHEAREEHYKADDASSAVAHETERESSEKLSEQSRTEEEESANNVKEEEDVNARGQNSSQGNLTAMGNDIPQNDVTTNGSIISNLNLTMKMDEKDSELVNDPIEMGIENTGALLNQIQEDLQQKSDPKATQLEEEEKTQEEITETNSQNNIVHESLSKLNTTTEGEGAKELLDHSNMGTKAVEGEAVGEETLNNSGLSEEESGKEMDPKSEDSSVSDPIDSSDSSSSSHLESSSVHTTTEGNNKHQDAAIM